MTLFQYFRVPEVKESNERQIKEGKGKVVPDYIDH